MGAYNPPDQVLFSPVSNFYQGKAIRQQLAAGEQDREFKDLQIKAAKTEMEQAPERWAMAKKEAESKQEAFDLSLEQAKKDGRWSDLQRSAQVLIPWVQEIGGIAGKDGKNSIEAMARANETSAQMIEQLSGVVSEDQLGALQELAGSDKEWQLEEFMSLGKYLETFMVKDKKLTTVSKGADVIDENGNVVYSNKDEAGAVADRSKEAIKLVEDFELDSIDKYMDSGNFSDLVPKDGSGLPDVKLTEGQSKGSGWYNQALTGNKMIEDKIANGVDVDPKAVAVYAEAIDDETGNVNRQILRKAGLSQDQINFFDSVNLMVDPVVRQSTGAAVKTFEFLLWFNSLIPQSNDPTENAQKSFVRQRVISGLRIAAGPGAALVDKIHEDNPTPDFGAEAAQTEEAAKQLLELNSQGHYPSVRSDEDYDAIPPGYGIRYTHPKDPPGAPPRIKE